MSAPIVVDRDALVAWFHAEGYCHPWADDTRCDCPESADRLIASGTVRILADALRTAYEDGYRDCCGSLPQDEYTQAYLDGRADA